MLTLLAALLLSGPPSVRAEDGPSTLDAADANSDGSVSGKERRQKRRADRRARRGKNGQDLSDEELDAEEAAESAARGSAASGKAASAASALKSSLPSADAGGGAPAGGPPSAPDSTSPAGISRVAEKPSGDPGHPKAPSDYTLAARSGYSPAFAAAGLKISPDGKSVLRLDGKPATPEDYARLQREIASMPAALGRRPDFFSNVSPAHYADLKRGYKEKKDGDQVYKDIGTTTEERDFVHTASCSKLSGDCNKNIEKESYRKGDFVAPEDLDNMWDALQKELDGSAEAGGLPNLAATRSQVAREKAMDAARALSDGGTADDDAVKSATREGADQERTPISQAVASVRRLWKRASSLALPKADGSQGDGPDPLIPIGAIALVALGAGVLILRRKG